VEAGLAKRSVLLGLAIVIAVAIYLFYDAPVKSLEDLRGAMADLAAAKAAHPWRLAALYFLAYVLAAALSSLSLSPRRPGRRSPFWRPAISSAPGCKAGSDRA
jgi:hypothetical protein